MKNDIPEINVVLISVPLTAKRRKLRTKWTPELAQDLEIFHGTSLFEGLVEIDGNIYVNEIFKEKFKPFEYPIIRIKCQIKKKNKEK